ncbi:hypothetical protein EVAR_83521_1 [Eumeta japonica]|uniref:Uncharacterized protein n=1 Tax=Eumeta variegata TaxID=151549 RepID=A0A4C1XYU8_EUMVA|nr:hypothetical protein EVAR_83521_1 [Eumeta japonica]
MQQRFRLDNSGRLWSTTQEIVLRDKLHVPLGRGAEQRLGFFQVLTSNWDPYTRVDLITLSGRVRAYRDSLRKMAKNVIRLCSVQYKSFGACGLFTVDPALPLRLTGLVATYCIVMLQFAFL